MVKKVEEIQTATDVPEIKLEDLFTDLVRFIDTMAERGAIFGDELLTVGTIRNILVNNIPPTV